jgi:pyruvate/2-oxoacid:ferredoxin oxidoreductase beta subunit
MARLAVRSRIFPLYEVLNGEEYHLFDPGAAIPVDEYLRAQGRFRDLDAEARKAIQDEVDGRWNRLCLAVSSAPLAGGFQTVQ